MDGAALFLSLIHISTPPDFHIAVNVAPEHLSCPALVADVQAFRGAIRPSLMVLEITERSLISDSGQARRNIETLREQGVFVACLLYTSRCV